MNIRKDIPLEEFELIILVNCDICEERPGTDANGLRTACFLDKNVFL